MDRRKFIKVFGGVTVAATVMPTILASKPEEIIHENIPYKGIWLTHPDRPDLYVGDQRMTVIELHRYLSDLADDSPGNTDDWLDITSETPSHLVTPQAVTINDPYRLTEGSFEFIYDGSVKQGDDIWTGFKVLGDERYINDTYIVHQGISYDQKDVLIKCEALDEVHIVNVKMEESYEMSRFWGWKGRPFHGVLYAPGILTQTIL